MFGGEDPFAFMEVDNVAMTVAHDLHLDMLGAPNEAFEENGRVAKGVFGLGLRLIEERVKILFLVDNPHSASSATEGCLDDEREANFPGNFACLLPVGNWILGSRQGVDVSFLGKGTGRHLVAHGVKHLRVRTDELNAGVPTCARKVSILGEKSVTRVNQSHSLFLRNGDNALDIKVSAYRSLFLSQLVCFVGLETMPGEAIFLRVDCDGP